MLIKVITYTQWWENHGCQFPDGTKSATYSAATFRHRNIETNIVTRTVQCTSLRQVGTVIALITEEKKQLFSEKKKTQTFLRLSLNSSTFTRDADFPGNVHATKRNPGNITARPFTNNDRDPYRFGQSRPSRLRVTKIKAPSTIINRLTFDECQSIPDFLIDA